MSHLQTYHLSHLPPSLALHVALYRDLKNASFLRGQLLSGNAEFEYAFIDASMVLSTTHVLAAAFRAVNDYASQRLKSRNVHSEIVFSLSPNNNIADSFRRFGVTDTTKDLLVIKVSTSLDITNDSVAQHLNKVVDANPIPFSDESLKFISDTGKITKSYKLGSRADANAKGRDQAAHGPSVNSSEEDEERRQLETCIIGAIALRGAV